MVAGNRTVKSMKRDKKRLAKYNLKSKLFFDRAWAACPTLESLQKRTE